MEMSVIQRRCWEFMGTTRYKDDIVYSADETIESAYEKAVEGHDAGVRGMNQVMPESTRIRPWMNFLVLCYLLYVKNM